MPRPEMSGVLVVNKPRGMVSKDVSRWLVKRLGRVKLGHVGTLDPLAEGILPILFGTATRLQDFLLDSPKTYECTLRLGAETDTLDSDGQVIKTAPWEHVTRDALGEAALELQGRILQKPPIYSARKFQGKPLYAYARTGEAAAAIDLEQFGREVDVHEFTIVSFTAPEVVFRVRCSKGTYVRVLAHDLAAKVGTCGTVVGLRRVAASGYDLNESLSLEEIDRRICESQDFLIPLEKINLGMPHLSVSSENEARIRNGVGLRVAFRDFHEQTRVWGSELPRNLLLLNTDGMGFAIGTAAHDVANFVRIKMRRSLR